jgi:hypothetical protein
MELEGRPDLVEVVRSILSHALCLTLACR